MSNELGRNRCGRTVVAILAAIALALATPITLAGPTAAAEPVQPACTAGATPVLYQGQWYCPGTALGVQNTAYGTGKRILLTGVSVTAISGTNATVSSITITSSCPPTEYCGATVTVIETRITVSLSRIAPADRPAVGAYGDFYGVTGTGRLTAIWFAKQDSGGACTNPAFC